MRVLGGVLVITAACATSHVPVLPTSSPTVLPPGPSQQVGFYHRVERGQTLWSIAKTYGVDLEQLVQSNRLPNASRLEIGQLLFIPGAVDRSGVSSSAFPRAPSQDSDDFSWPVRGKVVAYFGSRQGQVVNRGIDIEAEEGIVVTASRAGRVAFADEQLRGYGKTVIIDHGDGFSTVYAHNASLLVRAGQQVQQREPIARVGATGRATAPYLHFEIRRGHRSQNPIYYLP